MTRHGEWLIIVRRHRSLNLIPVFRPPRDCVSLVEAVFTLNTPSSTRAYALGTVAAAAFGALLYTIVTSDAVEQALTGIFTRALNQ